MVGAYKDDINLETDAGSAYVFTRTGGVWSEQAKLVASDAGADDEFGTSVAVSGDTVVVGAQYDDDGGQSTGSAYVYTRSGSTWSQETKLNGSAASPDDRMGTGVAVDGNTIAVSAYGDDHFSIGSAGSIHF